MAPNIFLIVGLSTFAIGPALADVTDVTVSGSVSGSGTLSVECFTPGVGDCPLPTVGLAPHETVMYSFSGNTQGSGGAMPPDVPASFIEAYADQDITATSDDISVTVSAGFSAQGVALFVDTSETDDVLVSFDLTQASLVTFGAGVGEVADELLDSNGNVIATIPSSSATLVTLTSGMYTLKVDASGGTMEAIPGGQLNITDLQYTLDASFAPVPEPSGVPFAAFLGLLIACIVSRPRAA
jgi:hypothetical protein